MRHTVVHVNYQLLLDAIRDCPDGATAVSALTAVAKLHLPVLADVGLPHCQKCEVALWPCGEVDTIAEHLGVVFRDQIATPTVPDGARRIVTPLGDYTLTYVITREAWYAGSLTERDRQTIHVHASSPGKPGWEFSIQHYNLRRVPVLRVDVFDDAFEAFAHIPDFFAALQEEKPTTLDGARTILDRIGAFDITSRIQEAR